MFKKMHSYKLSEKLERILFKLFRKNKKGYVQLKKKIGEVINSDDIGHYKNLRYDLKNSKRVHIGSFVLVFRFDKTKDKIIFDDFDHHDNVYKS